MPRLTVLQVQRIFITPLQLLNETDTVFQSEEIVRFSLLITCVAAFVCKRF